jgi:hypothetical protein
MDYLRGYDSVTGNILPTCFNDAVAYGSTAYANEYGYEMKMIETKAQLYNFIGASYQTSTGYFLGKNSVAAAMSNEFSNESDSIFIVIKYTWDGPVFEVKTPVLKHASDFKTKYPTYAQFVDNCGDSYISGIRTGVYFYAMLKITFSSTSEKNTVHWAMKNKTLPVKTSAEFNSVTKINNTKSTVTVTARILGGGPSALDLTDVKTVDQFFTYVDAHKDNLKKAIIDAQAGGNQDPSSLLVKGYAIHAQLMPFKNYISNNVDGIDDTYFTKMLGSEWNDLEPISRLFAEQESAYDQLDFMVNNPTLFQSQSATGHSLTAAEAQTLRWHRDRFKASASSAPDDELRGLQALMLLCTEPTAVHDIYPAVNTRNPAYTNLSAPYSGTARALCTTLYSGENSDPANSCNDQRMCKAVFDKLKTKNEQVRLPFFTTDKIITTQDTEDALQYSIFDTASNQVKLVLPKMWDVLPTDCAGLKNRASTTLNDGTYTVYYTGKVEKPFSVYCQDMSSAPKTYLPVDPKYYTSEIYNDTTQPTYNYSMYRRGGYCGTLINEYRGWEKYHIVSDASGVKLDTLDLTHTWHYSPRSTQYLNQAFMADIGCDQAGATNIDLTGTGLALNTQNVLEVWGWGGVNYRPWFTSHYYTDANNNTYIEGMTGHIPRADPVHMHPSSQYLLLDYVPDVATNNTGEGKTSSTNGVAKLPDYNSEFFCSGLNVCPQTPRFRESIYYLFTK